MKSTFKAYRVREEGGRFHASVEEMVNRGPEEGELLVNVHYSSLNYKDALSASGNRGVTRQYPHTPGIDAAGIVKASESELFSVGDQVIVTGFDLGMNTNGGFAEYIKVPADWAVALPAKLSLKEAMIYGTAGLTAGASVLKLVEALKPEDGEIVVSGATGGVGTLSIAILNKLGYSVVAVTGKESEAEYLHRLGAAEIILRKEMESLDKRPLLNSRFAGAIDTVGGPVLENIIKSCKQGAVVSCCGNVASADLDLTVYPFILRAVTLAGISSQHCPMALRLKIWKLLTGDWKPEYLEEMSVLIELDQLSEKIGLMLQGRLRGRMVLRLPAK